MTLSAASLEWAVQFVADHSDGDLFPRILEMAAIRAQLPEFVAQVAGKPLGGFAPGTHRRFIVPKDAISYRQATQLDPQDSIVLSAIAFEYGQGIENRRQPDSRVFSYRFSPTAQHGLYRSTASWNQFWTAANRLKARSACILYCDIADFYNQIYHHTVENQLAASNFPNQAIKWVISLLESTTAGVSRGVPIGPHAAHLIAEASLIPVDNSMATSGLTFLRYADDILVFSDSERDARKALSRIADILDKQQRLTLQRHKTQFFDPDAFGTYCEKMIEDRPINSEEDGILKLVRKYSGGDPYRTISYDLVKPEDWVHVSDALIRKIVCEYIESEEIDFIRLRWFYRRLAQIGHPGGIAVTLDYLDKLTPCFSSICSYLASIQSIDTSQWHDIGTRLLEILQMEEIQESEYFRLSILNLFARNPNINHFDKISSLYRGSDSFTKREVLLAAKTNGAIDWIREFKEEFSGMDNWQKMSFLFCCHDLPIDERKYFINRWAFPRPFDLVLSKWAKAGT